MNDAMRLNPPVIAIFILAALVGASAAAGMAALGLLAGQVLEPRLNLPVVSWGNVFQTVALLSAAGGTLSGALGAARGNWKDGLIAGAVVHALIFAGAALWIEGPSGVKVWILVTGVLAGLTAGGIGGELRRRASHEPPAEAADPGTGSGS
jgi:hypothetical protein